MILHGDCRQAMAAMEANSADAVVTDPPYLLNFMGRDWDSQGSHLAPKQMQAWHETWAREAFRVLKPGGHLVAFSGTRTSHRMVSAIEDAGFEIRDSLLWIYGSGFPKSLDVGKAIDKRKDDRPDIEHVVRFMEAARQSSGVTRQQVENHFGTVNIGQGFFTITPGSAPRVPTWEQWLALKALLGFGDDMDAEVWRLNGRKGQPGEAWFDRQVIGKHDGVPGLTADKGWNTGPFSRGEAGDITAPATDLAQQWDGWGTALKPAHEPICLARKPLIGTVAANVIAHGTGALNIDGTRILQGQRPDDILGTWVNEQRLCSSCAKDAGNSPKPGTSATRASTAPSPAAPIMSARAESDHAATNRAGTGCSDGLSQAEPNGSPSAVQSLSTGEYGSGHTDQYQPIASSTTSTVTSSTTASKTCNSCGAQITSPTTSGRWPSNVILGHHADCVPVGTRRVRGTNIPTKRGGNRVSGFAMGEDAIEHYADTDGTEEVAAWECAEGCPVAALDAQSGVSTEKSRTLNRNGHRQMDGWGLSAESKGVVRGDTGGASRFFMNVASDPLPIDGDEPRFRYVAKASRAERNAGLAGMPEQSPWASFDGQYAEGRNPKTGERTGEYKREQSNFHPTVKPIALMRWLCRLVTPPVTPDGQPGLILDPFCGSGSTGIAAHLEGFRFVGIEQSAEYAEIAERRIAHWQRYGEDALRTARLPSGRRGQVSGELGGSFARCPDHDEPQNTGAPPRRYLCGCAVRYHSKAKDAPVSTQERPHREQPPILATLPLFAQLAEAGD